MKNIYKIILGVVLLIVASIFFLKYIVSYLLPFVIAIIIASLIEPVVDFLENRANFSRGIAIIIILSVIIILISLLLTISFSRLFIELNNLVNNLPEYQNVGFDFNWLVQQNQQLSKLIEELKIPQSVQETINSNLQHLYDKIREIIQLVITHLLGILKKLPRLVTTLLISLIATFFISRDKELIMKACLVPVPVQWRGKVKQVEVDIINAAIGFIRAQMILITITSLISIVGLSLLGSSYSIVIGLSAGALDLVPIIGPSLIYIPWTIYSLAVNNTEFGIGLLVLYAIIGAIRQISEAKIVGQSIGIHPLATLMAMYLGVQLFGVTGFFIGPALLVVLKAIFEAGFISIIISD